MAEPDSALLARARSGDIQAFAGFVRLYERRVRGLLSRLLDDDRDIEEAAQDTFVQAWRNLDRFRADAAPFTWLYRIAVNEALQRTRRKRLDTRSLDQVPGLETDPGTIGAARSTETEAENRELLAFLAERLRALPPEYRVPLVLRDVEGWTNQEIAQVLGLSLSAAKSRIHRARMQLRTELDRWQSANDSSASPLNVAPTRPVS